MWLHFRKESHQLAVAAPQTPPVEQHKTNKQTTTSSFQKWTVLWIISSVPSGHPRMTTVKDVKKLKKRIIFDGLTGESRYVTEKQAMQMWDLHYAFNGCFAWNCFRGKSSLLLGWIVCWGNYSTACVFPKTSGGEGAHFISTPITVYFTILYIIWNTHTAHSVSPHGNEKTIQDM